MAQKLKIVQGATLIQPFRWGVDPFLYVAVAGVVSLAPLRLQVIGHNTPNGWRVEPQSFKGMVEINSTGKGVDTDFQIVSVVDVDTLELNEVNASDFKAYQAGTGVLKMYTPAPLTGHVAELTIWDKVNGTVLLTMDSGLIGGIVIDEANYVIEARMSATDTTALTWKKGVFALKMRNTSTGTVTEIAQGPVIVEIE